MGEWSSSRKRPRMHQKDAGWPIRASKYGGLPPPSVPPWEIRFCSQISWTKFCEDKKLTYLFENVLNWDDSAGKESFDNAKARYWAEMNGRRCDIPSPDPDMYIDAVNQHTFLDPRLVEDLYKPPPPSASASPSPPPHKAAPDYNSIEIIPTGWDVEDPCTSGATIPIYILAVDDQSPAKPSRCGRAEMPILGSGEPVTIVPTGWGDEGEVRSSNARKLSGIHSNDAPWSEIREESSWEHSECWNGRKYGSWGNRGGVGHRFGSKPATARGEEECYRASDNSGGFRGRRKNHTDEYFYWHGCAATGYHQR